MAKMNFGGPKTAAAGAVPAPKAKPKKATSIKATAPSTLQGGYQAMGTAKKPAAKRGY